MTITMPDEVARWARIEAAKKGVSVSRLLGEYVESMMAGDSAYDTARTDFLSRGPIRLRKRGQRLPSRDVLHDR